MHWTQIIEMDTTYKFNDIYEVMKPPPCRRRLRLLLPRHNPPLPHHRSPQSSDQEHFLL